MQDIPSVDDVAALDSIETGWKPASIRRLHIQVPMGKTVYIDAAD